MLFLLVAVFFPHYDCISLHQPKEGCLTRCLATGGVFQYISAAERSKILIAINHLIKNINCTLIYEKQINNFRSRNELIFTCTLTR